MPSLIQHLSKEQQRELFLDLNYLNTLEFRSFCREHSIPFKIWVETGAGARRQTRDTDRKSVVLGRIRHYLKTGRRLEATCFSARVVNSHPPPSRLRASNRLYYGWYDKTNRDMIGLLERLTDGEFRSGAIARILAREFWTVGKAPTFNEFAKAWLLANAKGLGFHPEAAWLTDRARNEAGTDWKKKRERKAKSVLDVLAQIESSGS